MSEASTQTAGQDNTAHPAQGDGTQTAATTLLSGQPAEQQPNDGTQPQEAKQQAGAGDKRATDEPKDGDKPPEDKEAKDKPQAPEKYELKAPEGFEKLDDQLVETFEPLAKELGLTNEQAQKLTDTLMPKVVERFATQSQEAWGKTIESWADAARTDQEIGGEQLGGNLKAAEQAIARFGSKEFKALINMPSADNPKGLGLGNHPELVRVFARIGKAMADDKIVNSNSASGGQRSAAEILFGDSK